MKEFKIKVRESGEEINVSVVSFKEMSDLFGKEAAKPLLMAAGYAASYVSAEQIEQMKAIYAGSEDAVASIEASAPGHSVSVLSDIDVLLSKENSKAIFLHEVGHIVNGHMQAAMSASRQINTQDVGGCNFIMDDLIEIEADAYAASFVGYHRLIAAVCAAVKAQAAVTEILSNGMVNAEEMEASVMAEVKGSARWAELMKYTEGY